MRRKSIPQISKELAPECQVALFTLLDDEAFRDDELALSVKKFLQNNPSFVETLTERMHHMYNDYYLKLRHIDMSSEEDMTVKDWIEKYKSSKV